MKLSELKELPLNTQYLIKVNALIARRGILKYNGNIKSITEYANISLGDAKKLAYSIQLDFNKDYNKRTSSTLKALDAVEFDALLSSNSVLPLADEQTPKMVALKDFQELQEQVRSISSNYASTEYASSSKKGRNIRLILSMINDGELEKFLDRLFTKEEGSPMSHDKARNVIDKLQDAIKNDENIALTSYFTKEDIPESSGERLQLIGKRTYWSTNFFKDTDDVIEYLTHQFYLD